MAISIREAITNYILDSYGLGRRGTNSGASASQVTDAVRFAGARSSERIEVGCALRITSGARAGDVTFLSKRPAIATGVMNVQPSFGGALDSTSNFQVLYLPLRFDGGGGMHDALNQALQEFAWEKRVVPVTEITDGDMLGADATSWSGAGGATLTKQPATTLLPLRYLELAGSGAGQNVQSNTIPVQSGQSYYLEITGFRTSAGGANGTLSLQDITNGGSITIGNSNISEMEPQILWNGNVSIPSNSSQVAVRIAKADGAGNNIGVSNVIFRKNWMRFFTLQDRPQRVLRVGRLLSHQQLSAVRWDIRSERAMREIPATTQQIDAGLWQIHAHEYTGALSLWYEEFVQPAALTTDAAATAIPMRHIAPVAAEILLRPLAKDSRWSDLYIRVLREAIAIRQDYQERMAQVNESPFRITMAKV